MKEYDADGIDGPWLKAMESPLPTRYDRLRKAYTTQHQLGVDAARRLWNGADHATRAASGEDALAAARILGVPVPMGAEDAAVTYRLGFKRTWRKCQNKSGVTP